MPSLAAAKEDRAPSAVRTSLSPTGTMGTIGSATRWQPPSGFTETETCAVWERTIQISNTNGSEKTFAWTTEQREAAKTAILLAAWFCRKIPAFISNASDDKPIKLVRCHLHDPTALAEASNGCIRVDQEFLSRTEFDQARTLIHELTHLVDERHLISEQPQWYDIVGRRILKFRNLVHWPINLDLTTDLLHTAECGLPSCYAAKDLTEALAEFNATHIIAASYSPIEVLDEKTNRVTVFGKDIDPDSSAYIERILWQPLPAVLKETRREIASLPKNSTKASIKRDANVSIATCTKAVRLVGSTPYLNLLLTAAWLDLGDDEMAHSSLNQAMSAMTRIEFLNDARDVAIYRRWQNECSRRLRQRAK